MNVEAQLTIRRETVDELADDLKAVNQLLEQRKAERQQRKDSTTSSSRRDQRGLQLV